MYEPTKRQIPQKNGFLLVMSDFLLHTPINSNVVILNHFSISLQGLFDRILALENHIGVDVASLLVELLPAKNC
jgi:hypothetical protein